MVLHRNRKWHQNLGYKTGCISRRTGVMSYHLYSIFDLRLTSAICFNTQYFFYPKKMSIKENYKAGNFTAKTSMQVYSCNFESFFFYRYMFKTTNMPVALHSKYWFVNTMYINFGIFSMFTSCMLKNILGSYKTTSI